jgi:DegV family protein with EDD domain
MPVCIVSDSTALFPNPVFQGRDVVHLLPTAWRQQAEPLPERLKAADLPASLRQGGAPMLAAPTASELEAFFRKLGSRYDGVLAILHSARFSQTSQQAIEAASALHSTLPVRVIDSTTVSLGLGFLVQAAAKAAEEGLPLAELDLYTRSLLPKVYGLLCVPGLSYLHRSGHINPSQAMVGEYLDISQVYTLDEGELVPTQKARNTRHLVDILFEFLDEFVDLKHVALLQGAPPFEAETRALRERLAEERRTIPISEQIINAPFASLVGPRTLGIFALDQ